MVKKEAEKISYFDDQFDQSAIADFVFANKVPLVTAFTRENAPLIFESLIERQLLLFATSNDSEKVLPIFEEAAKFFKRKLNFGYVEMEYKDVAKRASDYFGVTGHVPKVLAYRKGNDNANKYILDGELTPDEIKAFGEDFLEDKLKPFFKSKPIPETNDGAVKIVVGINFDDIVLDESKDVLLKIYEPWSNNCQALEPNYNQLAKYLSSIKSLVIAKIDGTTNEHPKAKVYGFPTFLFFPAGNKSSDPQIKIVYTDRTVMALYKFLKKHISMPLEWCRPASAIKCEASDVEESRKSITINLKDEF